MSEFRFATGHKYIDGRIVHSYSYDNKNQTYSVTCDVQFRRNNTSYDTETQGTINYTLYLYYGNSSSTSTNGSKYFKIPNNADITDLEKRWKSLLDKPATFTGISLGRFKESSYKVGFESYRNSGGPTAYTISLKTSPSYTVGPYAAQVGAPQNLDILSDGNNNFKIKCKVGADGDNNDSQGVQIYYTTDGTDPDTSTKTYEVREGHAGTEVSTSNIHITWDTTVKTRAYTIPEYENDTNAVYTYSAVKSTDLKYSPVFIWGDGEFKISCVAGKRPTPRESYEVKMPTLTGPDGLTYKKQLVIKNGNRDTLYDDTILGNVTIITFPKNYFKDSFHPGDKITAYLIPRVCKGTSSKSGDIISSEEEKDPLTILTPSNVKININGNTSWVDGQPYVYDNGWKESTGVFIHNGEGWKESI